MTPKRTDIDFDEFRKLLIKERDRLTALHQQQRADIIAESRDEEDAETGAILNDQGREAALDENALQTLQDIDAALARIADGTYGICIVTGEPIPVPRLRAIPWATMTVEAAEQQGR